MASDHRSPNPRCMHVLLFAGIIGYGYVHNLLHGSEWGSNSTQEGAIHATLVSTAALPLPDDHPLTDNVLATEIAEPGSGVGGAANRASPAARCRFPFQRSRRPPSRRPSR